MSIKVNIPNFARKTIQYGKALGVSMLVALPSCNKVEKEATEYIAEHSQSTTTKLLSLLERGDRHAEFFTGVPEGKNVIFLDELSNYSKTDSLGELFYQVYVGKADSAIRAKTGKEGKLVTVGQGITGLNEIRLAGGLKAKRGDYISAHSVDSIMNLEVAKRDSVVRSCVSDSLYQTLKPNELDAVLSYLFNVKETLLKHPKSGKSFFEYLNEGNKGMVQSKFNVLPSAKSAESGIAKRNIVQILVFGDGKVYDDAMNNFLRQVDIVKKHHSGKKLLKEAFNIAREYGVKEENLIETEKITFAQK